MPILISGLTNVPDPKTARKELRFTLLLVILLLIFYYTFHYVLGDSHIFFLFTSLLMTIHLLRSMLSFKANFAIITRYLLLSIPIYLTSIIWFLYQGQVKVHHLGFSVQTLGNTVELVTGGALSSLGCAFGWYLNFSKYRNNSCVKTNQVLVKFLDKQKGTLTVVGCLGAMLFGIFYLYTAGGIISSSQLYATKSNQIFAFNASNSFQMFFASLAIVSRSLPSNLNRRYLIEFIIILSFFTGILAGSRMDYMFPILMILSISLFERGKNLKEHLTNTINYKRLITGLLSILVFLTLAYFISLVIGEWRNNPQLNPWDLFLEKILNFRDVFFITYNSQAVFSMETAGHMIGGFYSMIAQRQLGISPFLWGQTYFLIVPRLLPAFIRPKEWDIKFDLAWQTGIGDEIITQGGIFEPAEAYANFGIFGCFLVSSIISYLLARLLTYAFSRSSLFLLVCYITCGLMMTRATWYQNFVFARLASVLLVFYILIRFMKPSWLGVKLGVAKS
jgi:hypothetical protein